MIVDCYFACMVKIEIVFLIFLEKLDILCATETVSSDRQTSYETCVDLFIIALSIFEIAYSAYLPFHTAGMAWMEKLYHPTFALPCWLGGLIWPVMYLLMTVAVWLIWQRRRNQINKQPYDQALVIFVTQFVVNILWGPLIVNTQNLNLALLYACTLFLLAIVNTISFWRVSKLAGLLLIPYILWTGYFLCIETAVWRYSV